MNAPSILLALILSATAGFGMAKAAMKPIQAPAEVSTTTVSGDSCLGYVALNLRLSSVAAAKHMLEKKCGGRDGGQE